MINKKLFKKNYILFISMFIAICFGCILSGSLKVNAYHLDELTGNLVSDNLIDVTENRSGETIPAYRYLVKGSMTLKANQTYTFSFFTSDAINTNRLYFNESYFENSYFSTGNKYINVAISANTTYSVQITPSVDIVINNDDIIKCSYSTIYQISNIMLNEGSVVLPYEPYGKIYFYGQQSYDDSYLNGYDKGYSEGYDVGFTENNFIPNIYISSATYIYRTNLSGSEIVTLDVASSIGGFSGVLDFSFAFTYDYPIFAYSGQSPTLIVGLLTPISVEDILKFDLSNIDRLNNLQMVAVTFFAGDNLGASLTYQQIIDNDYEFSLKDVYPDISFSEFSTFMINYYYNGNDILSGIRSLTDISYTMGSNEQYDLGYKVGYITGKNDGLINGEEIGYDKGYSEGYKKASQVVSKPGNNTLVGMVGALVETPVNMFIDIFNFEFLGINLVAFFFSLLTLIIVIWLIKYLK